MVTKKKGRAQVKVGKLNLKKETVNNLTSAESKRVKGGVFNVPVKQPRLTNSAGCSGPTECRACGQL